MERPTRTRAWTARAAVRIALGAGAAIAASACGSPHRGGGSAAGGGRGGDAAGGQAGGGLGGQSGGWAGDASRPPGTTCSFATGGFIDFKPPVEQCRWDFGVDVVSTPIVVDLTGDGQPEVVFPAFDRKVHAISGTDCKELWATPFAVGLDAAWDLAAGDLDGDGKPEIVQLHGRGASVYSATGAVVATVSSDEFQASAWAPAAIANVDGVGPAEIVAGTMGVFRLEGGTLGKVWARDRAMGGFVAPATADLDGDGVMEIVGYSRIYDGATGATRLDLPPTAGGIAAIAELVPGSPGPEIVLVRDDGSSAGNVVVVAALAAPEPAKVLFGPYSTGGGGGPPAVADFDGDGQPEIGVAGRTSYSVFDLECAATPRPARCVDDGVLWRSNTQDASSGVTTSTVFDFNCDGKAEVIYRDECWLRVYEGATGRVLFATSSTSNTTLEGAVVADTDGSGHAKIVISTNAFPKCPSTPEEYTGTPPSGAKRGVYIYRDPDNRWAPTRRIWNQNAYHVTNVNEDGSIPAVETPSWSKDNTFRANPSLRP